MPDPFWLDGGDIKIDGSGDVIQCATCPCVDQCTRCDTGTNPYQYELDASGLTISDSCGSGTCDAIKATFTLTQDDGGAGGACAYFSPEFTTCDGGTTYYWELLITLQATDVIFQVTLYKGTKFTGTSAAQWTWAPVAGNPIDCDLSAQTITLDGGGVSPCDVTAGNITLTAL